MGYVNGGRGKMVLIGLLSVLALVAAACGDDDTTSEVSGEEPAPEEPATEEPADEEPADEEPATDEPATEEPTDELMAFTDVCPERIVLQTNWFPQAEHGGTYQLIGAGGEIDPDNGTYTGPLSDTGLELEIRSGSQYIGFQPVTSVVYQDPDVFFAYIDSGEAIEQSGVNPMIGVMANLEVSPLAMLWDPETYDFETIADIRDSGATVLHFDPSISIQYFIETGQLSADQTDASFDGSPGAFIASGGDLVFQSFATNAPSLYEKVITDWGKPLDFLLTHEFGWTQYQSALSVRPETVTEYGDCLELLVPVFQQGWVDYMADPAPTNDVLLEVVETFATFWTLSEQLNADTAQAMADLGIVSNGPDDTIGNFDMDRIQSFIEEVGPVFVSAGAEVKEGLRAEDLATNEFIDPSIGL